MVLIGPRICFIETTIDDSYASDRLPTSPLKSRGVNAVIASIANNYISASFISFGVKWIIVVQRMQFLFDWCLTVRRWKSECASNSPRICFIFVRSFLIVVLEC